MTLNTPTTDCCEEEKEEVYNCPCSGNCEEYDVSSHEQVYKKCSLCGYCESI